MFQDKPLVNQPQFCNIPASVLQVMTCGEVSRYVADLIKEAEALAAWNNQRGEPVLPPEKTDEQNPSPPRSHSDYGKWSQKINGRYEPCSPASETFVRIR